MGNEQIIFITKKSDEFKYLLLSTIYSAKFKIKISADIYEAINFATINENQNSFFNIMLIDESMKDVIFTLPPDRLRGLRIFILNNNLEVKDMKDKYLCNLHELIIKDDLFAKLFMCEG